MRRRRPDETESTWATMVLLPAQPLLLVRLPRPLRAVPRRTGRHYLDPLLGAGSAVAAAARRAAHHPAGGADVAGQELLHPAGREALGAGPWLGGHLAG